MSSGAPKLPPRNVQRYVGKEIEGYYSKRPLAVLERFIKIGPPALAWWIEAQIANRTAAVFSPSAAADAMGRQRRAKKLRRILASSGDVTFIKSGQAMSLRNDLLKDRFLTEELAKLQDEVGTFPTRQAMTIIAEDLGRPADEIFEFVQREPVASASIGQVYKAKLRRTGEMVAVKVQRPEALESAGVDMFVLRRAAAWLKRTKKLRSDVVGIADEFGAQLFNELDYEQE
ncbi:unnamed protein product, partial [Phaeothamnion confervicola]